MGMSTLAVASRPRHCAQYNDQKSQLRRKQRARRWRLENFSRTKVGHRALDVQAEGLGLLTFCIEHGKINWADEMEDAPMPSAPSGHYGGDRGYSTGGGYGSSGVNGLP